MSKDEQRDVLYDEAPPMPGDDAWWDEIVPPGGLTEEMFPAGNIFDYLDPNDPFDKLVAAIEEARNAG